MNTGTTAPKALLLLGLLTPLSLIQPALAQTQAPQTINLPAQPLDQAVIDLARQTGLAIGGDASLLEGKQAPALSGDYTPEQALRALLAGSGVTAVRVDSGYRLEAEISDPAKREDPDLIKAVGETLSRRVASLDKLLSKIGRGRKGPPS